MIHTIIKNDNFEILDFLAVNGDEVYDFYGFNVRFLAMEYDIFHSVFYIRLTLSGYEYEFYVTDLNGEDMAVGVCITSFRYYENDTVDLFISIIYRESLEVTPFYEFNTGKLHNNNNRVRINTISKNK